MRRRLAPIEPGQVGSTEPDFVVSDFCYPDTRRIDIRRPSEALRSDISHEHCAPYLPG